MDLHTVAGFRSARSRADLGLTYGETLLGGGTWLFSEPQPSTSGLVDLTTLGWAPVETRDDASGAGGVLRIAATCTVTELVDALSGSSLEEAARAAAGALVMSWKIQRSATVGGNVALALPAGAMTSLLAGLGATAVVWTPDGGERRERVSELVRGVRRTSLTPGEVLRALEIPVEATRAPAVLRRASLATHGRSGTVVVGRSTAAGPVLTVTAATTRPVTLDPGPLEPQLAAVDCWYDDPHGAPDWRAAMTARLARQVRAELAA